VQITASDVWVVAHNLGKYVSVDVIDTSGALMIGELHYTSLNQIVLSFRVVSSGLRHALVYYWAGLITH
jgi:hypothetical protein